MSAEQRIVRDADMLDAPGAVGIARAFRFGGRLGEPMWGAEPIRDTFQPGHTASIVHHFHEKLLHSQREMLTDEGRRNRDRAHALDARLPRCTARGTGLKFALIAQDPSPRRRNPRGRTEQ